MRLLPIALAALAWLASASAQDLTIQVAPDGPVYLHDANQRRGYVDLMIQTVVLSNPAMRAADLTGLHIDYMKEGEVRASRSVEINSLIPVTAEYAGMAAGGFDTFLKAQLLNEGGIETLIGPNAAFSDDLKLEKDELLLSTSHYASLDFEPDMVSIIAEYRRGARKFSTRKNLAVRRRESSIEYAFPLDGVWLMRGFPSIGSHHRWIPGSEFASDFFRVGADGAEAKGDPLIAENNYGYGLPVRAAADGEVVFVIDDAVQDRYEQTVHPGETLEQAMERAGNATMERMMVNFRSALAGNLVTIRHEGPDGTVEYSSYGHLKTGSVMVKVGDKVRQGQQIGAVGDTGDSSAVHLHFQVNEGPDAFMTRSLPFVFQDMVQTFDGQDPGLFVTSSRD